MNVRLIKDGFSYPHMSPEWWDVVVKRKCVCRNCGASMAKGEKAVGFCGSYGDGGYYNPWKAVEGKLCANCAPKMHLAPNNKANPPPKNYK